MLHEDAKLVSIQLTEYEMCDSEKDMTMKEDVV